MDASVSKDEREADTVTYGDSSDGGGRLMSL
jgi:hypothetical protein